MRLGMGTCLKHAALGLRGADKPVLVGGLVDIDEARKVLPLAELAVEGVPYHLVLAPQHVLVDDLHSVHFARILSSHLVWQHDQDTVLTD